MKRSLVAVAVGVVVRQQMIDGGIDAAVATAAGNGVARWVRWGLNVGEVAVVGLSRADGVTRLTVAAQASAAKRWLAGAGLADDGEPYGALPDRAYVLRVRGAWPGLPEPVRSVTAAWYVPTLAGMRASGPVEAAAWFAAKPGVRAGVLERRWLAWLNGLGRRDLAWPLTEVPGRDRVGWSVRRVAAGGEAAADGLGDWRVEARFGPEAYGRYDPMVMLLDGASLSGSAGVVEPAGASGDADDAAGGAGLWLTVGREAGLVAAAARAAGRSPAARVGEGPGPKRLMDAELSVSGLIETVNLYGPLLPGRLRLPRVGAGVGVVSLRVEVMREGWRSGVVVATVEVPDDAGRAFSAAGVAVVQRFRRAVQRLDDRGGEPAGR